VLTPCRITKDQADAFVALHHRHHDPDQGARFYVGAWSDHLCGVAVVGRPRAPAIPQDRIVEVTRCATDGTKDACSFLYGLASTVARAQGFAAIITYTLKSESGASLRALGWWRDDIGAASSEWTNRPGRKAGTIHGEVRWLKLLNEWRVVAPVASDSAPPLFELLGVA